MQRARNVVAAALLAFAVPAQADEWIVDDINEVLSKVRSVYTTVVGDVKDTAADLKRQLTSLTEKGQTLKDTVDDVLEFATWPIFGRVMRKDGRRLYAPAAEDLLPEAANLHRLNRWQAAYDKICDAYAKLI